MWSWMKSTSSKTPHWHSNVSLDSSWLVFKVQDLFYFIFKILFVIQAKENKDLQIN
jgi:hypothetical protein